MFHRLGVALMLLALFSIARGHWAVLQGVAWGQMLVAYSQQEADLVSGVRKTFDGEHPCKMCVSLEVQRGEERQNQHEDPLKKVDVKDLKLRSGSDAPAFLPPWGGALTRHVTARPVWAALGMAPELPPPRA